jgi:hypothetical protein
MTTQLELAIFINLMLLSRLLWHELENTRYYGIAFD